MTRRTRCHRPRPVGIGLDDDRSRHFGIDIALALAIVGATAAIAGTGIAVASAVQQANQEADLSEVVAEQKEVEGFAIRESAAADETQSRRRAALLIGRQRAIAAAAGIDPGYGSPLLQEIDLVEQAELEALSIKRVGALSATSRDYEAAISRYRGASAQGTIPYSIAGGALQAASIGASAYGSYQSNKPRRTALSQIMSR